MATFGCNACHTVFDSNGTHGLTRGGEDWLFYALRGMARTHRWWHQWGFLTIKGSEVMERECSTCRKWLPLTATFFPCRPLDVEGVAVAVQKVQERI
jgi:hypothetical protein